MSRAAGVGADAAKFVIKPVQVFAQQANDLHAELAVFVQKLGKLLARDEPNYGVVSGVRGDPVTLSCHALTQAQDRSAARHFEKLQLIVCPGQKYADLTRFHQVNAFDLVSALKQGAAPRVHSRFLDPAQGLP